MADEIRLSLAEPTRTPLGRPDAWHEPFREQGKTSLPPLARMVTGRLLPRRLSLEALREFRIANEVVEELVPGFCC
ncbi:hypothetical protein, partial [Paracoccus aerius]|uniref:hypothetical protein n=1 Tax=Paracoccus aerius TaxID=1915382 RepID=UPI00360A67A8